MSFPTIEREPVQLPTLTGHDDELWDTLIELSEIRPGDWTLIGGQMVFLHAVEHGVTPPRVSTDLDVLVNVRVIGRPIAAFVSDIEHLGFELDGISPDGIAHRYRRSRVTIDVSRPKACRIAPTSRPHRRAARCKFPEELKHSRGRSSCPCAHRRVRVEFHGRRCSAQSSPRQSPFESTTPQTRSASTSHSYCR